MKFFCFVLYERVRVAVVSESLDLDWVLREWLEEGEGEQAAIMFGFDHANEEWNGKFLVLIMWRGISWWVGWGQGAYDLEINYYKFIRIQTNILKGLVSFISKSKALVDSITIFESFLLFFYNLLASLDLIKGWTTCSIMF